MGNYRKGLVDGEIRLQYMNTEGGIPDEPRGNLLLSPSAHVKFRDVCP